MKVIRTTVKDMDAKTKAQCRSLSFRSDGELSFWLKDPRTEVIMIRDDNGLLIGWAAREYHGDSGYYVRAKYRRQGYGSFLYYTLNNKKKFNIIPHDKTSTSFFYSLGRVSKRELKQWGNTGTRRKTRTAALSKIADKISA